MAVPKFTFNARYIGRQPVKGPFSDSGLSEVVAQLRSKSQPHGGLKSIEDLRCNLEFCDKSLMVTKFDKKLSNFFAQAWSQSYDRELQRLRCKSLNYHQ
jgi:hypothetical protein